MLTNAIETSDLLLVNLLLQATVLSGIAIGLSLLLRNRAATVYGLLFPALISLLLLAAVSFASQFADRSIFYLAVNFLSEDVHRVELPINTIPATSIVSEKKIPYPL